MEKRIYGAPPGSPPAVLGRTLPSLLEEAIEKNPNPSALNQRRDDGWIPLSSEEFLRQSEEIALGLLEIGLAHGDRVCLFMESDVYFCVADMACLIAGLIDVPIYLTHSENSIRFVLGHAQARALVVTNSALLSKVGPLLEEATFIKTIVIAESEAGENGAPSGISADIRVHDLDSVRTIGKRRLEEEPEAAQQLKSEIDPRDTATVIYTSGTTGEPKGVMLTHQNISSNVFGAFGTMKGLMRGQEEVILSFLPLTHVFARMLHYGYTNYGCSVHFTSPEHFAEDLKTVRPTSFATVPHVIEKIYEKVVVTGAQLKGFRKRIFDWALAQAHKYDLIRRRGPASWAKLKLADRLVFSKWREAVGGRIRAVICGGAAIGADLVNIFAAAGIPILAGYGQTESSPVISYNREGNNRPGTVGYPLPGVEIMLAEDGEILTRGPHVMHGYYRNPQATQDTVDMDGWLLTGDIGEIERDGCLKITDRKKSLFKLSTGKYVIPQPIENRLLQEPLVNQIVVTGSGRKFCTALIFPEEEALRVFARLRGLDGSRLYEELLGEDVVVNRFQELVDKAHKGMPHWSTIKEFRLIPETPTPLNGLLTPTLKVRRTEFAERYSEEIASMYEDEDEIGSSEKGPTKEPGETSGPRS